MDYNILSDEEIIRNLAQQVEKVRIQHQIKETELELISGISRKTFYNFKQGVTGISLKNFIKILRAVGELDRLQSIFPENDNYSPLNNSQRELPKRVRDKNKGENLFKWGDES